MVATPHCGACSLSVDLTSAETPATGGRQRFVPKTALLRLGAPAENIALAVVAFPDGKALITVAVGFPHAQSSQSFLGAVALLVSHDSFGSLPAAPDAPLGQRFPRSPRAENRFEMRAPPSNSRRGKFPRAPGWQFCRVSFELLPCI